jgi:hypothetical protein
MSDIQKAVCTLFQVKIEQAGYYSVPTGSKLRKSGSIGIASCKKRQGLDMKHPQTPRNLSKQPGWSCISCRILPYMLRKSYNRSSAKEYRKGVLLCQQSRNKRDAAMKLRQIKKRKTIVIEWNWKVGNWVKAIERRRIWGVKKVGLLTVRTVFYDHDIPLMWTVTATSNFRSVNRNAEKMHSGIMAGGVDVEVFVVLTHYGELIGYQKRAEGLEYVMERNLAE